MVEIFKSNNKTVRRVVLISYIFLLFQICFSTFMSIFFSIKKKKLILKKKKKIKMKQIFLIIALYIALVFGDCYMHNPRGRLELQKIYIFFFYVK